MQFLGTLARGPSPGRLLADHAGRAGDLAETEHLCRELSAACWAGCPASVLKTVLAGLRAAQTTLQVLDERDAGMTTAPLSNHIRLSQMSAAQLAGRDN